MYIDILLSKKSKYFFLFQYPKLEIDAVWKKVGWDRQMWHEEGSATSDFGQLVL